MTYAAFFKDVEAIDYYRRHWSRTADWSFAPSAIQNWELQHPPAYYLLAAPIMKATEGLSLPTTKFWYYGFFLTSSPLSDW